METNEALDKIYVHVKKDKVTNTWNSTLIGVHDVEYTRTDAFIEKACKILAKMVCEVIYEDLEGNSTQHYDKMEFIDDFRKYMRGE